MGPLSSPLASACTPGSPRPGVAGTDYCLSWYHSGAAQSKAKRLEGRALCGTRLALPSPPEYGVALDSTSARRTTRPSREANHWGLHGAYRTDCHSSVTPRQARRGDGGRGEGSSWGPRGASDTGGHAYGVSRHHPFWLIVSSIADSLKSSSLSRRRSVPAFLTRLLIACPFTPPKCPPISRTDAPVRNRHR